MCPVLDERRTCWREEEEEEEEKDENWGVSVKSELLSTHSLCTRVMYSSALLREMVESQGRAHARDAARNIAHLLNVLSGVNSWSWSHDSQTVDMIN